MGERGEVLHVLGAAQDLARLGRRVARLGANARWVSFVALDTATRGPLDDVAVSDTLGTLLLHVWFDDDAGVAVQAACDGVALGELHVPLDEVTIADGDLELLADLDARGAFGAAGRGALVRRLAEGSTAELATWAREHGLERALELPVVSPVPVGLPAASLETLLPPEATVIEPRAGGEAKPGAPRTPKRSEKQEKGRATEKGAAPKGSRKKGAPAKAEETSSSALCTGKSSWTDQERRVLELHVVYWLEVFSMNNFKLYNRYKKHLPPAERGDVDRLCDAVALGDDEALRGRVTSILARVWHAEDWDAVVRDPRLEDGDPEAWAAFRARLAATS